MKKFFAILASVALACTLAFTVTSCQSNVDKAIACVEDAVSAAKKGDVEAFKKAVKKADGIKLSEKEEKELGEKIQKKLTASDFMILASFASENDLDLDL